MKLNSKLYIISILLISCLLIFSKANNYDSFISGLTKSFDVKIDIFKQCYNKDWSSGAGTDTTKCLDKFNALQPMLKPIAGKLSKPYLVCQLKNQVKEHWLKVVSKADKKATKVKAKKDAAVKKGSTKGKGAAKPAAAKKKAFIQFSLRVKRKSRRRTKWEVFSDEEKNILKLLKAFKDLVKCSFIVNFNKILDCMGKKNGSNPKVKKAVDIFTKGCKDITVNINGFVDFMVNFICSMDNFKDASKFLDSAMAAGNAKDIWLDMGKFLGKMYESLVDNTENAR